MSWSCVLGDERRKTSYWIRLIYLTFDIYFENILENTVFPCLVLPVIEMIKTYPWIKLLAYSFPFFDLDLEEINRQNKALLGILPTVGQQK